MAAGAQGALDGSAAAGPCRVGTVERRLSDLLPKGGVPGPEVFLADPAAVREAVAAGSDPVLYHAVRGVLPPRTMTAMSAEGDEPGSLGWSADLVVYQDGTLPGSEPFRSIGHWNPAGQLEIFQVLSGRVLIVTSGTSLTGQTYAHYQECRSGDVAVIPFGAWHLTYALNGPAMVFNTYTSSQDGCGLEDTAGGPGGLSKYRSGNGPAQVAAARENGGLGFVIGPEALARSGEPTAVSCPQWLRVFLPPGASLADWCVRAADAELRDLADSAQAAARCGWPT